MAVTQQLIDELIDQTGVPKDEILTLTITPSHQGLVVLCQRVSKGPDGEPILEAGGVRTHFWVVPVG